MITLSMLLHTEAEESEDTIMKVQVWVPAQPSAVIYTHWAHTHTHEYTHANFTNQ